MKLSEVVEKKPFTPEQEKRAQKRFKELMVDVAGIAPGPFKAIAGSPYYLWSGSDEHGTMEINLIEPDEPSGKFYVYIKAKDMDMRGWNKIHSLRDKGWNMQTKPAAAKDNTKSTPRNILHVDIQL